MRQRITDLDTEAGKLKSAMPAGMTIACAESLTGGLVGHTISRVSGASAYYLGTLCAYSIDVKASVLNVDREHAATCDCVSVRVAQEMAVGAHQLFGANITTSCTGFVTKPDHAEFPYCYWAIAINGEVQCSAIYRGGPQLSRVEMQQDVALFLLKEVRTVLAISAQNPPQTG